MLRASSRREAGSLAHPRHTWTPHCSFFLWSPVSLIHAPTNNQTHETGNYTNTSPGKTCTRPQPTVASETGGTRFRATLEAISGLGCYGSCGHVAIKEKHTRAGVGKKQTSSISDPDIPWSFSPPPPPPPTGNVVVQLAIVEGPNCLPGVST